MKRTRDVHRNAKELIEAAERSGILREVAELLWFANKHGWGPGGACAACELLDRLTDAFDEHVCLAGLVGDDVFNPGSEGLHISPRPDEAHEVDAFIGE
jgi:hypothetical protein